MLRRSFFLNALINAVLFGVIIWIMDACFDLQFLRHDWIKRIVGAIFWGVCMAAYERWNEKRRKAKSQTASVDAG